MPEIHPQLEDTSQARGKLISDLNAPWKMWLYLFVNLPSLVFWGVRIRKVTEEQAEVTLPYSWKTQNPFQSIYFAAQCGAAEISTGLLAKVHIEGKGRFSMLITDVQAHFLKKATGLTTFSCQDGALLKNAVEKAVSSGEAQKVTVTSTGTLPNGDIVAQIHFTWSFKRKD